MPKPDLKTRIIAGDLPEKTYTRSSFDNPLRKDVIQTEIPTQVTRTFEENSDPRYPPKRPVAKVSGIVYHGTGSVDPKVVHGTIPNFIEKKNNSRKKAKITKRRRNVNVDKDQHKCRPKDFAIHDTKRLRTDAIAYAKEAYVNSGAMLDNLNSSNPMVLDVKTTNKREYPDVMQYENNVNLKARLNALRRTPLGVKAAHTIRRLGR
jgi:hypothetical protein